MATPTEVEGASVVLVGNFNPALVHPAWLVRHGLVRENEEAAAEVKLVRPELSLFTVGPFTLQTEPERFTAQIIDIGQLGPLRDLVVSVFSLLSETPIRGFGLNRHMHFRVPGVDAWHRVGHALAPKSFWTPLIENPGMRALTMHGRRAGSEAKTYQVLVEPSARMPEGAHGVYVGVNEHFDVEEHEAAAMTRRMVDNWQPFFTHARLVGDNLVALGGGT